ncbi:HPr kinase/phosphorylase [Tabrizicola sp. TH137]|uniref:HPr kinase/phosphorylase n=1 Tax=Tabrizicola sp. TH137 TaxID=2067452 RepID=UPI0020B42FED|nr:HPr kinase/phosphatase C-terminal domain-containing protein [Tabrizicola sp. TH137]
MEGRGVLIIGPSGSGKSELALALMAHGARLVADDRVTLSLREEALRATCPAAIRGMIEARGLGLLEADPLEEAEVTVVVDLGEPETERLPPRRVVTYLGRTVALVRGGNGPHFPAALLHYVRAGRRE